MGGKRRPSIGACNWTPEHCARPSRQARAQPSDTCEQSVEDRSHPRTVAYLQERIWAGTESDFDPSMVYFEGPEARLRGGSLGAYSRHVRP
eukprot:scaffold152222_cov35-Tisochrysis_lutea.AAC.1